MCCFVLQWAFVHKAESLPASIQRKEGTLPPIPHPTFVKERKTNSLFKRELYKVFVFLFVCSLFGLFFFNYLFLLLLDFESRTCETANFGSRVPPAAWKMEQWFWCHRRTARFCRVLAFHQLWIFSHQHENLIWHGDTRAGSSTGFTAGKVCFILLIRVFRNYACVKLNNIAKEHQYIS